MQDSDFEGKWVVPKSSDQLTSNYICQSPKIPSSFSTLTPTPTPTSIPRNQYVCMESYIDIVPSSSKCYAIMTTKSEVSWDDAMKVCNDMLNWEYDVDYNSFNTQLLSIESETENDELFDQMTFLNISSAWIGLSWTGKLSTIII